MEGFPWGGSEELWSRSAATLLERGHKVTTNTNPSQQSANQLTALARKGAQVHFRRPRRLPRRLLDRFDDPMMRFLKRTRPDFVVISQGNNSDGLIWMEACAALSITFVSIAHCALPWLWPDDETARRLRLVYPQAKKAYFVSRENLGLTERQVGLQLTNAEVVRNPFGVPFDADLPWPDDNETRLGFVARMDTYIKGHDLLLDVLSQPKWRSRALRVTLYGSGRNEQSLKAEYKARGLDSVRFAGFIANPLHIWRTEQCLLLPSRAEGLPLAIVEAMLCSRPCIVTNVSGNAELLEDNVTGFIARAATPHDLDEALERAWIGRSSWQEMGKRAARYVRQVIPADPVQVFVDDLLSLGC